MDVVRDDVYNSNGGKKMTEQKKFGVNVWWTIPSLTVDVSIVQAALVAAGFEKGDIPEPSRRAEVSRAVYSLQNRRGKENRRVTELTNDNGVWVTYGILDRGDVDSETVEFSQETTVRLNKSTGEVQVSGRLGDEVIKAICDYTGKVTDEDIRGFLRKVIKMCRGVAKRPTGGIYFVPDRFASIAEGAQQVLTAVRSNAKIYVEGVVNGVRERNNVWEAVERDIESEVVAALDAVSRIEKSARACKGHQSKLENLNDMVSIYSELLGEEAKQEELSEKLASAVQEISHKISELQKGTAATVENRQSRKRRGSKVVEAAVVILEANGGSMHYKEITDAMVLAGTYVAKGKYAADSVRKLLNMAVDDGDVRISVTGRGVFQHAEAA